MPQIEHLYEAKSLTTSDGGNETPYMHLFFSFNCILFCVIAEIDRSYFMNWNVVYT